MPKQYSIAQAKDQLPMLVREAEKGKPVEITRRGKPVAVIVSKEEFERAGKAAPKQSFMEWFKEFRKDFDPERDGVTDEEIRSWKDGRPGKDIRF